jgi:hypothetical protein
LLVLAAWLHSWLTRKGFSASKLLWERYSVCPWGSPICTRHKQVLRIAQDDNFSAGGFRDLAGRAAVHPV